MDPDGELARRPRVAGARRLYDLLPVCPPSTPHLSGKEHDAAIDARQRWFRRFGRLLGEAAASGPRATRPPSFLASFLVGGVRFQVARLVLRGEGADLLRLLSGTLETLLACHFEPGEPRRLARAVLDG